MGTQTNSQVDLSVIRNATHTSFRFVVTIAEEAIAAFTECTLPTIEWEMEPVKEGGLNTYVHQLPGRRKQATVSLKYGVATSNVLIDWYLAAMREEFQEARKTVTITFYSGPNMPMMAWNIEDCIPVKWVGPQLKSSENTIAIQTLDLACGEIEVAPVSGMAMQPPPAPTPWVPRTPRVAKPPAPPPAPWTPKKPRVKRRTR